MFPVNEVGFSLPLLIPTFSPQGDGNLNEVLPTVFVYAVDPYLFPARGRKLSFVETCHDPGDIPELIPTFSPQGDGNIPSYPSGI